LVSRNLKTLGSLFEFFNDVEYIEIKFQNKAALLFLARQPDTSSLENLCLNITLNAFQCFYFRSLILQFILIMNHSTLIQFLLPAQSISFLY
jgi:hypothetical protein